MRNPEVDHWFEQYENPMKPVVQAVREVILNADPRIEESIKWKAPTFGYKGNLASFFPKSKKHASLMFHVGATIPGNFPSLEGTGDTSRVMKLNDLQDVESKEKELQSLVAAWIDLKS